MSLAYGKPRRGSPAESKHWYRARSQAVDQTDLRSASMPFRPGQLLYFVTVAEEGQVTRAARKLEIAQPALSQAIAQLEGELGLQLLERHARGGTLTAAGEICLPKARAAVDS